MKKPRRQAPTVVAEGYPSIAIPPAAPLAAEPSVVEPTSGEFAPGLGKINLVHIIRPFCGFPLTYHQSFLIVGAEAAGEQGEHYDPLFTYGAVTGLSLIHISEPTRQAESRMPSSA